jgi:acyl-CoA dehydrogenase family protein 9
MKTVDPKEIEDSLTIPSHVIQSFRELDLFGLRIHDDYKGWNLLNVEFMQVLETIGRVPSLGFFLLKHSVPPIDILNKYGTIEQKFKYLPQIALGQSFPTVAITENDSGPAVNNLDTIAILSKDCNYWILDGKKTFVSNINQSDVFIVFGHGIQGGIVEKRPETMATFIVDKNTSGVNVVEENIPMAGLKGFNTGKLILKNVKVPKENMIGEIGDGASHLIDYFSSNRHYNACLTIPILKNFLNTLTQDILHRKHFNKMMFETEAAQHIFANITLSIYCIESVLYLTTATMDIHDNQDLKLETALVEQFCLQECIKTIQECMWLVGPRVCTLTEPYEKMLRDALTITNYDTSLLDTKIFSALTALQHVGTKFSENIKKERNIIMFPKYMLNKFFRKTNSMNFSLEQYLHPSLQECTISCDRSLFKLQESAKKLLIDEGTNVIHREVQLQRLSDMAALIYTYIAVLGRASRSYCIGNRDSESEIKMCIILAYRLHRKVNELFDEIHDSEFGNGDYLGNQLSNLNFDKKDYIASHPLQRNY